MTSIVMSSGHGLKIRGASGYLDEVDEARRVVDRTAEILRSVGVEVTTFHDDVSTTKSQNLDTIVGFHNAQQRDLDISVHFNAFKRTDTPMGTECLYLTQQELAAQVSQVIANAAGLPDRGAKKRTDLAFLNKTDKPAILIEVCFVDSSNDANQYSNNFEEICFELASIAKPSDPEAPPMPPVDQAEGLSTTGKVSWFGGPNDKGVAPDEGLAFIYKYAEAPHLFLPQQPPGTSGLARRLDPKVFYVACRWDYSVTPKDMLRRKDLKARVSSAKTEQAFLAWPADWGPHQNTGRVADISPGLMDALGIRTDDVVTVVYPAPEGDEA
jgi:hypothetical protein